MTARNDQLPPQPDKTPFDFIVAVITMKITVLGNSVGLRVRPPENPPANLTYSEKIEKTLNRPERPCLVTNNCIGRSTIREVLNRSDDNYNTFPDFYILNIGITDACSREIPLWLSNMLHGNRTSLLRRIMMGVYVYFIAPRRRLLTKLRFKKGWTKPQKFNYWYKLLIKDLLKNSNAKIVLVGINKCSERIEIELPGTMKRIDIFNDIIKSISAQNRSRMTYIDTAELDLSIEQDLPDGIHYSSSGHSKIADKLTQVIEDLNV